VVGDDGAQAAAEDDVRAVRVVALAVQRPAALHVDPVQREVDLADERRHALQHRLGYVQHHLRLLGHDPVPVHRYRYLQERPVNTTMIVLYPFRSNRSQRGLEVALADSQLV